MSTQDINLFLQYLFKVWRIKKEENSICADVRTEKVMSVNKDVFTTRALHYMSEEKKTVAVLSGTGSKITYTAVKSTQKEHLCRLSCFTSAGKHLNSSTSEQVPTLTFQSLNIYQLTLFFQLQKASYFQLYTAGVPKHNQAHKITSGHTYPTNT